MNAEAKAQCTMHAEVLRVENVGKHYPGTVALKQANFSVRAGAVNVLVGENGAGKSTLMKIIAGVEQPSSGKVLLDGREVHLHSTRDAVAHGIGMVFQELNLFPNLSIADNIFIGCEITGPGGCIDRQVQEQRANALMARLEHPIPAATLVGELRIGQQQIVEIAKALSKDVRILIMDEPTSALSAAEVQVLFRVIAELKARNVAIVYISHRLEELVTIGDYITILRDGRVTATARVASIDVNWIVQQMAGGDTRDCSPVLGRQAGEEVLRVENLTLPRSTHGLAVDHVSLSLRAGEIVGIYGLMGAGRTELFECIFGLHPQCGGAVTLAGRVLDGHAVDQRIRHGLALIPEDRKASGFVHTMTIGANLTLSALRSVARGFHLDSGKERTAIGDTIRSLRIKVPSPEHDMHSLSGGNQQKVVIGRALMTRPKVLLMDEPSRGIDVGAKADVFKVMRELAAAGLGILFVTSDLDEVLALSDRILVMSNGRITAQLARAEASEETLVRASAAGL